MTLHLLGAALGVDENTRDSILYDYSEINEAAYQMLVRWKREKQKHGLEASEMKNELRKALRSEDVSMKQVVALLKDHFSS